jgi:hypothetical protein
MLTPLVQIALKWLSTRESDCLEFASCIPHWKLIESNGFSGTVIVKLEVNGASFALRSWPNQVQTHERIAFWRAVSQTSLAPKLHGWHAELGADSPWLAPFAGSLWTMCDWVDASPVQPQDIHLDLCLQLCERLNELHQISMSPCLQTSSSLAERLQFLQAHRRLDYAWITDHPFLNQFALNEVVMHGLNALHTNASRWERQLVASSKRVRRCQWVVRDLWYANVLIDTNKQFSSIVDFGAARIDWPGLDFIRLVGSMQPHCNQGENVVVWKRAWDAYRSKQFGFTNVEDSLEECMQLAEIQRTLSLVQWMDWIRQGHFNLADEHVADRIANRVHELSHY